MRPEPVDSCEVLVLVDNVSDLLSTVPQGVTGEVANVVAAGASELAGRCLCCAQWGLSLLITLRRGETRRTVLFDAGPEAYGILRNAERLGVDFGAIDEAVFSHGHWDQVGGRMDAPVRNRSSSRSRPSACSGSTRRASSSPGVAGPS